MKRWIRVHTAIAGALAACGGGEASSPFDTTASLGEALFHDTELSANRTQACATCHDPDHAFIDSRRDQDGQIAVFSVGDDGVSLGGRNAPSAAYSAFVPGFNVGTRQRASKQSAHRVYEGAIGGLFWDGRATSLEEQAGGPPLSAVEMGMPSMEAFVDRLRENPSYVVGFEHLFGADVFDTAERAYSAFQSAVASFERTEPFSPFDSKYDRSLVGDVTLTFKELTGKSLFFSEFASCPICHQLHGTGDPINRFRETFTGYEYHNVGTPARAGQPADLGRALADAVDEARGLFKVPTLRNIAVTEPYMHNGVFRDLRTVVEFYDKFVNEQRTTNPETGLAWAPAGVPDTVNESVLRVAQPMTDFEVEAMVCFLRTLTDARYEHLIEDKGIDCD